ncbi:MAG TPA: DUF4349 domain-containing protein [Enhygromyxa sp.]|nr:DUF4349 domain-containing protein [Enhygromyxa sp.]
MSVARALARAFTGALLALPLACLQIGSSIETNHTELIVAGMALECPVGSEGCPCTAGGGCDPGLTCVSGICSYGDGDYGSVVYEFEDDIAVEYAREAPPAPAPTKEYRQVSRKAGRADRPQKRRDKLGKSTATSGAAAPEAAPVGVEIVDVAGNQGPGDPAVSTELENLGRQVIYTATLQVAVFDRDAAIALAESLPERWGGWIDSRYDYQITLRVPAERLFEAIELIAELGVVLGKTLQADDVTAEYVDLESRIRVLEEIVAHLEMLLKQATTVEQALKIRLELDRMRIELEAARARMRQLSELIDFSTLTLYFSERGPDALPSSNDPFPWVDKLGVEITEYR